MKLLQQRSQVVEYCQFHINFVWFNLILFTYLFCPNLILLQIKCVVITLIRLLVQPECRVLLYLSSLCQDLTCFTPGRRTLLSGVIQGQYPGLPGQGTCRNEVVLTQMQDARRRRGRRRKGIRGKEEGESQPSFWEALICTWGVSDECW